jgi:hypothetical protein
VSRGSALIDTLVAALVTALLLQGALAACRLQAAGETAAEAAAVAATWAARHGDTALANTLARALAPEAESISVGWAGDRLSTVVRLRVALAGPDGAVSRLVVGRASAPVSPYRSNLDG